jgi:hypothetical protein
VKRRQHINFQLPDNYGCTLPARIHMDREYDLFEIFPDGVFLGEFRRGAKGLGPSPADSWQWSQRLSEPSDQSERDVAAGGRIWRPWNPAMRTSSARFSGPKTWAQLGRKTPGETA